MKINSVMTKERFKATGRNMTRWATAKGHNPGTVSQLINGYLACPANMETTESGRIIANLKADDLLVTDDDHLESKVAA